MWWDGGDDDEDGVPRWYIMIFFCTLLRDIWKFSHFLYSQGKKLCYWLLSWWSLYDDGGTVVVCIGFSLFECWYGGGISSRLKKQQSSRQSTKTHVTPHTVFVSFFATLFLQLSVENVHTNSLSSLKCIFLCYFSFHSCCICSTAANSHSRSFQEKLWRKKYVVKKIKWDDEMGGIWRRWWL